MKKQSNYTMKKVSNYFLSLLALAGVLFVTGCGEDETPAPAIPVIDLSTDDVDNQDGFTGFVGDEVSIDVSVDAPQGFNTLRVFKQVDGVKGNPIKEFSRTAGVTQTSFDTTFTYTIQEEDVDNTIYLVFQAVDDTEGQSEAEYQIIAETRPTVKYEMKLLYAPNADMGSETFFSTNDGETYSVSEVLGTDESVSPKIDFGYFYGQDFEATIASPAAYPIDYSQDGWNERNETKIKRTEISASQYLEIQTDVTLINNAFDEASYGESEGQVRNLTIGEVLAFELVTAKGNKRGLIKVNDIEGTTGTNDYIEIEVIVVE